MIACTIYVGGSPARAANRGQQAVLTVEPTVAIASVRHPVRVQDERVAGIQPTFLLNERRVAGQAQDRPARLERLDPAGAARDERRLVTGSGESDHARRGVHHEQDGGHHERRRALGHEDAIDAGQGVRRTRGVVGGGVEKRAHVCHEQRRRDALAGHVRDQQADAIELAAHREGVEQVAPDLERRLVRGREGPAGDIREAPRHERELDATPDRELVAQPRPRRSVLGVRVDQLEAAGDELQQLRLDGGRAHDGSGRPPVPDQRIGPPGSVARGPAGEHPAIRVDESDRLVIGDPGGERQQLRDRGGVERRVRAIRRGHRPIVRWRPAFQFPLSRRQRPRARPPSSRTPASAA